MIVDWLVMNPEAFVVFWGVAILLCITTLWFVLRGDGR
jgi:hypothetical protein